MKVAVDDLVQKMANAATSLYTVRVSEQLGDIGTQALRLLIENVRKLYKSLPCETMTSGLLVFVDLGAAPKTDVASGMIMKPEEIVLLRENSLTIEIVEGGRLKVWRQSTQLTDVPNRCLAYHFTYSEEVEFRSELLVAGGVLCEVENFSGFPSAFGIPSYSELSDALDHYRKTIGFSGSPDRDLDVAWRDGMRMAFSPKPEKSMRRSLEFALRYALSGCIVRPEQNVDESHPVDIQVEWPNQARIAWIEIKWLGHSAERGAAKWTTNYSASRAVDGARQLANYLDSGERRVTHATMGYLVVFDARRRRLSPDMESINRADGLHYELQDIDYPEEVLNRTDFAQPVRLFLRPRCAA